MKNLKQFEISKNKQKSVKGGSLGVPECNYKPNFIQLPCGICINKYVETPNLCEGM